MRYVAEEDEARVRKRGMWAGRFVAPWDWRRGERIACPGERRGYGGIPFLEGVESQFFTSAMNDQTSSLLGST